jgi:DNA-directed RNA polymerase subunit RPC12/RpoP
MTGAQRAEPAARREAMAESNRGADGVLVQVCLTCGKEYMFDAEPPSDLACDKCGSTVFRSFVGRPRPDEVDDDFREATDRDTLTTDPATDVTQGDLHDLGDS